MVLLFELADQVCDQRLLDALLERAKLHAECDIDALGGMLRLAAPALLGDAGGPLWRRLRRTQRNSVATAFATVRAVLAQPVS